MFKRLRRVEKSWGQELWLHNSPMYCGKILEVEAGQQTSFHYHNTKHETFTVLDGRAMLWLGGEIDGGWHVMEPGSVIEIAPYETHALRNEGPGLLRVMEVSTQHFEDDSVRLGRPNR